MNIIFIGSGNVATHLATAMRDAGHRIVGICSQNIEHAERLACLVEAQTYPQVELIPTDADIYIISISDDNIADVVSRLLQPSGIVAHTAGSIDMSVLSRFDRYGVFYPLQSFTRERNISLQTTPFCIEGSDTDVESVLVELALSLSTDVRCLTSAQRRQCHLAAVFASNFVNCMYAEAEQIMSGADLPMSMLEPLVAETADKAFHMGAVNAQTGPARRGDLSVMRRQLQALPTESLRKMYRFVSEEIMTRYGISNQSI